MKKNSEFVGVDEKFIPENEKYVDESLLGNKEESRTKIKKFTKKFVIGYIIFIVLIFAAIIGFGISMNSMVISNFKDLTFNQYQQYEQQKEEIMKKSEDNKKAFEDNKRIIEEYESADKKMNEK